METKKSKISVRNLSRTFYSPQGEKIEALKEVNLEVEDAFSPSGRDIGEFRVLLGPSGCGKSTLLRIVAGLDTPDSGGVLVHDQQVHGPSKDRGMVFQKYTSFPWLTVRENVEYGMKINRVPAAQRTETADRLLKAVGLADFAGVYPETLSGGMQQRVAIARTLAVRPSVILMDEPFGALDAQTRSEMQQLLLGIWDETACTILFVTHDVEEAVYLADRIFIMSSHPGTIVEDVEIPFERPRSLELKEKNEFHELQHYVLSRLKSAPGAGGHVRVSI
jgi:NitT/TauT family transport system ATP-binding protein